MSQKEYAILSHASRPKWLETRRQGIGGSDVAAILGLNPWKSPLALYVEKLGIGEKQPESERMRWGNVLEAVVAREYRRETSRKVRNLGRFSILRRKDTPWAQATLDRVVEPPNGKGPGVLEIKTTAAWNAKEWEVEPPVYYQAQLQYGLWVTGYGWGSLAVLIGGQKFLWQDLDRHGAFIEMMRERCAEFWRRVELSDPPPADASESSTEALRILYPREAEDKAIALPPEAVEWDLQRLDAEKAIKEAEKKRREAENKLRSAIGAAAYGTLPDGTRYSFKASVRKGYTVAEKEVRTLRRHEPKK